MGKRGVRENACEFVYELVRSCQIAPTVRVNKACVDNMMCIYGCSKVIEWYLNDILTLINIYQRFAFDIFHLHFIRLPQGESYNHNVHIGEQDGCYEEKNKIKYAK